MLMFAWPSLKAQTAETPAVAVTVNGKVVAHKVNLMVLLNAYDDGIRYSNTAPRVALVCENGDTTNQVSSIAYLHPYTCRVLFGDAITGVDDLRIYEIVDTEGQELQLRGLKEGEVVQVYNTSGGKCLSTRAGADGVVTGFNSLAKGVYIIKAGKTVFKYYNRK
jgi:hypothetical protein